jgi:hypothetical protein
MHRMPRLRPRTLLGLAVAWSGCYMSYAEQAEETAPRCRQDSDCHDGLACTRDECGADRTAGRLSLVCVPRGVVAVSYNETATLRCPAE